jgi:hypothetical protein
LFLAGDGRPHSAALRPAESALVLGLQRPQRSLALPRPREEQSSLLPYAPLDPLALGYPRRLTWEREGDGRDDWKGARQLEKRRTNGGTALDRTEFAIDDREVKRSMIER